MPNLKHPKSTPDIYKFENVRFADAPTGSLRFAPPATPTSGNTSTDPTGAIKCHNVNLAQSKQGLGVPYFGLPEAGEEAAIESEDCLFLDIYAPASLFANGKPTAKVPVIAWIYGGAYVGGAKNGGEDNNPLYTGVGALKAAQAFNQNAIFVAGNYRLGAFGWLAGTYVEDNATANIGLLDQRFLLSWIQQHISQVGGDPSTVSAWGESAGAGSILHHLVLNDGSTNPFFSRALLQSPAFVLQWDREGVLNDNYKAFASQVPECPSLEISCLRSLPPNSASLINANQNFTTSTFQNTGLIPFGPAVDGKLIKHLPANELAGGKYFHGLKSIVISHVEDEAAIFVPSKASADSDFTTFVSNFMPQSTLAPVRDAIATQYPAEAYPNVKARLNALIRDGSFTCNNWQLFQAYSDKTPTYMMEYDFEIEALGKVILPALHGTDLAPTFWNNEIIFWEFLQEVASKLNKTISKTEAEALALGYSLFSPHYQSYLVSNAIYGDPNQGSFQKHQWNTATTTVIAGTTKVSNVQMARFTIPQFTSIVDNIVNVSACNFWQGVAAEIDPVDAMQTSPPLFQQQEPLSEGEGSHELR